ncbi:hypothetical protein TrCOL_g11915 [Triparma columacea]|uniref:Exocyst subunit Exo70 family protein n=1 Tax=Triparma columacea TaxID=722753 RepID=A0A9W7FZ94_9STRA|nr:hypothetical protein TrCOL_g11915 [Triparma columacea]
MYTEFVKAAKIASLVSKNLSLLPPSTPLPTLLPSSSLQPLLQHTIKLYTSLTFFSSSPPPPPQSSGSTYIGASKCHAETLRVIRIYNSLLTSLLTLASDRCGVTKMKVKRVRESRASTSSRLSLSPGSFSVASLDESIGRESFGEVGEGRESFGGANSPPPVVARTPSRVLFAEEDTDMEEGEKGPKFDDGDIRVVVRLVEATSTVSYAGHGFDSSRSGGEALEGNGGGGEGGDDPQHGKKGGDEHGHGYDLRFLTREMTGNVGLDAWVGRRRVAYWEAMGLDSSLDNKEGKQPLAPKAYGANVSQDAVEAMVYVVKAMKGEWSLFLTVFGRLRKEVKGLEGQLKEGWSSLCEVFMLKLRVIIQDLEANIITNSMSIRNASNGATSILDLLRIFHSSYLPSLTSVITGDFNLPSSSGSVALTQLKNISALLNATTSRVLNKIPELINENDDNGFRRDAGVWSGTSDVCAAVRNLGAMGKEIQILLKSRKGNKRFKWQSGDDESDPGDDYAEHLAVLLVGKLEKLGEGLKHWGVEEGESIKSLWMVNNAVYMESHMLSGGGGDGEDEGGIGKVWFKEMIAGLIRKNRGAYVRSTFERLSSHLTDVDKTKFKYQTGGKLLTLECGRELKSRFGGFADDMEAIHKRHTHLSVPSYEVREALIREGVEIVKERYEWFWREYGDVQFSKKKQLEYMRISPVMVEAMIREFYSAAGETYLPGKVTLSAVTTSSF